MIFPSFSLAVPCLQIPSWDSAPPCGDGDQRLIPPESQAEIEVITAISNLSNTVIAATASRSLAKSVPDPCLIDIIF
jgi:rapamycin-insensitive companion of mTOR